MRFLELPCGEAIPILGLGTWRMGEDYAHRETELAAVRYALDQGVQLIDTAEMYGEGGSEDMIGEAVSGRRDDAFIVSKVYPHNAHFDGVVAACERSLQRLKTDWIDLYLLHWRGQTPFEETLKAFETLKLAGKIRHYGVSNLDCGDMDEWFATPGGNATATNQVLYNLSRRGVEWDLLPACRERNLPIMAYSPLEQGRLTGKPILEELASRHGVTSSQIALAWVLDQPGVIAIPKAANQGHIDENLAALNIKLDNQDYKLLEESFPPPSGPSHLEML